MRKAIITTALVGGLVLGGAATADARAKWLSPRDGWRPVPVTIRAQFHADGIQLGRHARIRYGDTTTIDQDGRPGGLTWTS
jgi:hypothetical protein